MLTTLLLVAKGLPDLCGHQPSPLPCPYGRTVLRRLLLAQQLLREQSTRLLQRGAAV